MKISLTMNGKEFLTPDFNIYNNDSNDEIYLGLKPNKNNQHHDILNNIDNKLISISLEKNKFIFETEDKIIWFQHDNIFLQLPQNKKFKLSPVLINDKN